MYIMAMKILMSHFETNLITVKNMIKALQKKSVDAQDRK